MITKIKTLNKFVEYCESLVKDSEDEDSTEWFIFAMAQNLTKDNILEEIELTLDIYYKWLGLTIQEELYACSGVIYQAITIEEEHYKALCKQVFKKTFNKEIKTITTQLKTKHNI